MAKVLVADDDESLSVIIRDSLSDARHVVEVVHDGAQALSYLETGQFDVVVLDWMMPKLNGLEVLKHYRQGGGKSAVLMLTTKSSVEDRVEGLTHGADDYLPKPFSVKELAARVNALLRRPPEFSSQVLTVGDLKLDASKHSLQKGEVEIHLQPTDFALLEFFMRHPSEAFSSDVLLDRVWHNDSRASTDGLRMSISRIRKALDEEGSASIIETVAKVGYRLRQ